MTQAIKGRKRKFVDSNLCESLFGGLMNLTITRTDIVYGIGLIGRYVETPRESHWLDARRILRYIVLS